MVEREWEVLERSARQTLDLILDWFHSNQGRIVLLARQRLAHTRCSGPPRLATHVDTAILPVSSRIKISINEETRYPCVCQHTSTTFPNLCLGGNLNRLVLTPTRYIHDPGSTCRSHSAPGLIPGRQRGARRTSIKHTKPGDSPNLNAAPTTPGPAIRVRWPRRRVDGTVIITTHEWRRARSNCTGSGRERPHL